MAETKRIALQPADNGQPSKKSSKTTKQIAPSFRFEINLIDSNDEKYTEVNYAQLLKTAEKKHRKEKKKDNLSNGCFNPLDDDDDKILDVARYYEEKYGKRKRNDYVDLGAGYDENDSFIDNTDAYDEVVPEEVTTVHGGFYVNSGPLEFKDSDKVTKNNANSNNEEEDNENDEEEDDSDDDDESSSEDDTDDQMSSKKTNKRALSSSENEETEKTQPPKSKLCVGGIEPQQQQQQQQQQQPQQQQQQQQQPQPPKIMIRTDLTEYQQPPKPKMSTDDSECVIID